MTEQKELRIRLQGFAHQVGLICALEAGEKMLPTEAYEKIRSEWKKLKKIRNRYTPKTGKERCA